MDIAGSRLVLSGRGVLALSRCRALVRCRGLARCLVRALGRHQLVLSHEVLGRHWLVLALAHHHGVRELREAL